MNEGLYLRIDRQVETKCGYVIIVCDGDYSEKCFGGVLKYPKGMTEYSKDECPDCHGTGQAKRRLRGWVKMKSCTWYMATVDHAKINPIHNDENAPETLRKLITAAYLDGTLMVDAPEIAKNLTLEVE